MPLPTSALKTASVDSSENAYLKPLWHAVNTYNMSGGKGRVAAQSKRFEQFRENGKLPVQTSTKLHEEAMALQDIMFNAAQFLTMKPPSEKRGKRWEAMTQLMGDVNREAARIGVKLVDSPTDFKTIGEHNASVWLEVVDPQHRNFGSLGKDYERWREDGKAAEHKVSFWNYIGDKPSDEAVLYDQGAATLVEKNDKGRFVEIQGHNVSTRGSSTIQTNNTVNQGWAVFAVTTDGRLHIGDHSDVAGAKVRHTSLTGGAPIMAAGEICVVDGKIAAISNLTGHYKLDGQRFVAWLASTPLLTPDVLVKARFDISYPVVKGERPELQTTTMIDDYQIAGARLEDVRKWCSAQKARNKFPFEMEEKELKKIVWQADWNDLRGPEAVPGITDDTDMDKVVIEI